MNIIWYMILYINNYFFYWYFYIIIWYDMIKKYFNNLELNIIWIIGLNINNLKLDIKNISKWIQNINKHNIDKI